MINYGVVYPQAILIFVITLLYSVIQPLIVVFGAIYFGAAYVVYKYKLLFGMSMQLIPKSLLIHCARSILQTIRVTRSSVANHVHSTYMGRGHLPRVHVRDLHPPEVICPLYAPCATLSRSSSVGVVHGQEVQTSQ